MHAFSACRVINSVHCFVICFHNCQIVEILSQIIVPGPMVLVTVCLIIYRLSDSPLQNVDPIIIESVISSAQLCLFCI